MSNLDALIERVRDLRAPDRDADAAIAEFFSLPFGRHGYADEEVEIADSFTRVPAAALRLVDQRCPRGWRLLMKYTPNSEDAWAQFLDQDNFDRAYSEGPSLACCIVLSLLLALKGIQND